MHLFARYEFQHQWFWNNWNNIFPIINIYYYKYQRNVRVRYKTPSLSFFFFLNIRVNRDAIFRIFSRCKIVRFIFRSPFVARRVQWKQRRNTETRYCQRIFNLQASTANSNALFSVTFGHKESLSTVINYFMGGKSISPGQGWKVS